MLIFLKKCKDKHFKKDQKQKKAPHPHVQQNTLYVKQKWNKTETV